MKSKNFFTILAIFSLMASGCAANEVATDTPQMDTEPAVSAEINDEIAETTQTVNTDEVLVEVDYDTDDLAVAVADEETTLIKFDSDTITINGDGASYEGNIVTISTGGTFQISGTLMDGRVVVDTEDEETVSMILSDVAITSSDNSPIYILNADKTVITLAEGTENYLTDSTSYTFEDDESSEPNAALFSNDDLTINGNGSLTINANFNHGIVSNDDLMIVNGNITVNAVGDGIKGKDSVSVSDGDLTINAGNDGIQSYNTEDLDKGNVLIEGGDITITAGLDGIQAENTVQIHGGIIKITAGNGSATEADVSLKGIKGRQVVLITGGRLFVDAVGDALHTNGILVINDGTVELSTGDDGIHARCIHRNQWWRYDHSG